MRIAKLPAGAAREWLACGLDRLIRERERWVGAALVYLLAALILQRVPFLGDLVLILLTPPALAGLLLAAEYDPLSAPVPFERRHWRALAQAYLAAPARVLARVFRDSERLLPALMLGVLTLGGYVVAQIAGYLLIGGTPAGGLGAIALAGGRAALWLVPLLALIYALLVMALFYGVTLTVLDELTPPAALVKGLRAVRRNLAPLLLLVAIFLVPYAVIAGAFGISRLLGYPLLLTLGTAALALFLPVARCSADALFRRAPAA